MGERGVLGNNPIIGDAYTLTGRTIIDKKVPAPVRGIVRTSDIYVYQAGTFKVKFFRDDGTNYVFLGERSVDAGVGQHLAIPCGVMIEKGDFIAFYSVAGTLDANMGGGNTAVYVADVTTTTPKSSWSSGTLRISLRGHIFYKGGIIL